MDPAQDVVIIGGGIIGAATAYELARQGVRATLLERSAIGGGQSGRNWGFVRQQGRSPAELPLMVASNRRWASLESELDAPFDWVQGGNLALATDAGGARRYREWTSVGRSFGVDTRLLEAAEVESVVPGLSVPFTAALYAGSDGHADPGAATRAYAAAAARLGARVLRGRTVLRIATRDGRVTGVDTDGGRIAARTVVCAAGSASRRLLRTAGVRLPQNVVRGTVTLTEPVAPLTRASVWMPGVAFRQRPDGRLVVSTGGGGEVDVTLETLLQAPLFLPAFRHNYRRLRIRFGPEILRDLRYRLTGHASYAEPRPTASRIRAGVLRLREAVPALAGVRLEKAWAGLIDSTPDALPVIDAPATRSGGTSSEAPAGLVLSTGFSGHGFGLAPAAAEATAALVLDERPPYDLHPFRLSRFPEHDFHAPDAIL